MFGFRKHVLFDLRDRFFHFSIAARLIPDVWISVCRTRRHGSNGVALTLMHLIVAPPSLLEKSAVQGKSLQGSLSGPTYPAPRQEGQDRSRVTPSALECLTSPGPVDPTSGNLGTAKPPAQKSAPLKMRPSTRRFGRFWAKLPVTYPVTRGPSYPGAVFQRDSLQGNLADPAYPVPLTSRATSFTGKLADLVYPAPINSTATWVQGNFSEKSYPATLDHPPGWLQGNLTRLPYPVTSIYAQKSVSHVLPKSRRRLPCNGFRAAKVNITQLFIPNATQSIL